MNEAPDDAVPFDTLARELHEVARLGIEGCPAWEDLDKTDPWEAGLIRLAYDRARDFIAISDFRGTAPRKWSESQDGEPSDTD